MLAGVDFELIHDLLHVGDLLGEGASFILLMRGLHRAGQNERAVLGLGMDALVVENLARLDCGCEVIFNGAVELGVDGAGLALVTGGTNADLVRNGVVGSGLPGEVLGLRLLVVRADVPGKCHNALVAILRDTYAV